MKSSQTFAIAVAAMQFVVPLAAADAPTSIMSPVASYQYPNDFTGEALTSGGIASPVVSYSYPNSSGEPGIAVISPIVSYQYLEWPGDDLVAKQNSAPVSYYYQFIDAPLLNIAATSRVPTAAEIAPAVPVPVPLPSQFETFESGSFTTNPTLPLDPSRMTVVLTHGWKSNPATWALNIATLISSHVSPPPNIVTWNWEEAADSIVPFETARNTKEQGALLGQVLFSQLGQQYAMPVHFIGHSMGTLVNATAADRIIAEGYSLENLYITLFDDAEIAMLDPRRLTLDQGVDFSTPKPFYGQPLPARFAWADNYISAVGMLHADPRVLNVVLTENYPKSVSDPVAWYFALVDFHAYPYFWYEQSILSAGHGMGFQWSFERSGTANAPRGIVLHQGGSTFDFSEADWTEARELLDARVSGYFQTLALAFVRPLRDSIETVGNVAGEILTSTFVGAERAVDNWLVVLRSRGTNIELGDSQAAPRLLGESGDDAETVAACAWIPLVFPTNVVAIALDFKVNGELALDRFVVSIGGANSLAIDKSSIESGVLHNSGLIDVAAYAGRTNELFVGIVGNTSPGVQITVQDVKLFTASAPSLRAKVHTGAVQVSWPLWAHDYVLESSPRIAGSSAWMVVTNLPRVLNSHNNVEVSASNTNHFFRLRK